MSPASLRMPAQPQKSRAFKIQIHITKREEGKKIIQAQNKHRRGNQEAVTHGNKHEKCAAVDHDVMGEKGTKHESDSKQ